MDNIQEMDPSPIKSLKSIGKHSLHRRHNEEDNNNNNKTFTPNKYSRNSSQSNRTIRFFINHDIRNHSRSYSHSQSYLHSSSQKGNLNLLNSSNPSTSRSNTPKNHQIKKQVSSFVENTSHDNHMDLNLNLRQPRRRRDSNKAILDHNYKVQYTSELKDGRKIEWCGSYDAKIDDVCYPSLKYLDALQHNSLSLADRILSSNHTNFFQSPSSNLPLSPPPQNRILSFNQNKSISPKKNQLEKKFSSSSLSSFNSNSRPNSANSNALHSPYSDFIKQTQYSPMNRNHSNSLCNDIDWKEISVPLPTWKVKISQPLSISDKTNNVIEKKIADDINSTGELHRRQHMIHRYEVLSCTDSTKQKLLLKQRKLMTPIEGVDNTAKSLKSVRRIELEEDETYRELKSSALSSHGKRTKRSEDEEIFEREKYKLFPLLLTDEACSMEGLLYYRYKNDCNQREIENNRRKSPIKLMSNPSSLSLLQRRRSLFSRKLLESSVLDPNNMKNDDSRSKDEIDKYDDDNSNNSNNISKQSDENLNKVLEVLNTTISNLSLTRVKRAAYLRQVGYDYRDITSDIPITSILHPNYSDTNLSLSTSSLHSTESITRSITQNDSVTTVNPMKLEQRQVINKRNALDILTLSQLEQGTLPEQLIKKNIADENVLVDLSHYGIGNVKGKCLAEALTPLDRLSSLSLHDNRLDTSTISYIVKHLPRDALCHLDLSRNDCHMFACEAISSYLHSSNNLVYLNLSHCHLDSSDTMIIANAMQTSSYCLLKELILSHNNITSDGIKYICQYLERNQSHHNKNSNGNNNGNYNDSEDENHSSILMNYVCTLESIDLSWNKIDSNGAILLAEALKYNTSLKVLNLSMNTSISDHGGQRLVSALSINDTLQEMYLMQTTISHSTCFILAQVLHSHPTMHIIDISCNPLGEAGARCLFRSILRGLKCNVRMDSCEYTIDERLFNHSFPAENSPYSFDLSDPYDRSVLYELIDMAITDSTNYKFGNIFYQRSVSVSPSQSQSIAKNSSSSSSNTTTESIKLFVSSNEVLCDRNTGMEWEVPLTGYLTAHYEHTIVIPTIDQAIDEKSLHRVADIVSEGKTDQDKKNVLKLICLDIYCTTNQIDMLMNKLSQRKALNEDGLTRLDVLKSIWCRLLDPQNLFDFMVHNLDIEARKELIYALSFDNFKFNWLNPTSHWRLNLNDKMQRATMQQLVAVNNYESEYSRTQSKRGDTSQWGNWYNFRNVRFNHSDDFILTKEFLTNLPHFGVIEFDYVSTTRPAIKRVSSPTKTSTSTSNSASASDLPSPKLTMPSKRTKSKSENLKIDKNSSQLTVNNITGFKTKSDVGINSIEPFSVSNSELINDMIRLFADSPIQYKQKSTDNLISHDDNTNTMEESLLNSRPNTTESMLATSASMLRNTQFPTESPNRIRVRSTKRATNLSDVLPPSYSYTDTDAKIITDSSFFHLLVNLGLHSTTAQVLNRSRETSAYGTNGILILLELQHAAAKYYFPCSKIIKLLEYFAKDSIMQARVVVCLFSRIWDLYNFDSIMRCFREDNNLLEAQTIIISKLGCLNIVNPLKPSGIKFNLCLKYSDSRILIHSFLEISSADCTDQFVLESDSDLAAVDLYGATTRLLVTEGRKEVMKFSFAEFGERSLYIAWPIRRDQIRRYLVGDTTSFDRDMLRIISMYKELEKEKILTKGSIETQFSNYLVTRRSTNTNSRGSSRGNILSRELAGYKDVPSSPRSPRRGSNGNGNGATTTTNSSSSPDKRNVNKFKEVVLTS